MLNFRLAQDSDRDSVAALMNAHNLELDKDLSRVDADTALGFINGYFEPNKAVIFEIEGSLGPVAAVNLHPDSRKRKFQVEVFCEPGFSQVEAIVDWTIQKAQSTNNSWEIWPGANANDERLIHQWGKFGFTAKRRFSVMRLSSTKLASPSNREDISISAIDTKDESQLRSWHALHQNAFADHFGFTPRPFDEWIEMVTRDPSFDPVGVLMGYVHGEPVGFCHHTDEFSSDNRGFIIGLGVSKSHQGFGYGEALLKAGIAYSLSRGYSSLELAVDTGNESGALKLYEKVGFQVTAAWVYLGK